MDMKKTKQYQTFGDKIQTTYMRHSKITFVILASIIFLFFLYEQGSQMIVIPKLAQKNVVTQIEKLSHETEGFIDSLSEIETNAEFYRYYYRLAQEKNIHSQVIVYDAEGKVLYITNPSLEGSMFHRTFNHLVIDRTQENTNTLIMTSKHQEAISNQTNTLMFAKTILDQKGAVLSVLVFIDSSVLNSFLQHQNVNQMLITDDNNYVIATTSPAFVGSINRFENADKRAFRVNDTQYRISKTESKKFKIYTLIIKKSFFEQYGLIALFSVITLYALGKMNRKVARRMGDEAAQSINQLMTTINQIKDGDLGARVSIDSHDEFQNLGLQINNMAQQVNLLMDRNEKLIEIRKNAQIKQLEAQFNPHFLYNSLETIRYLIEYDAPTAQKMILNITKLLRYSIDGNDNFVRFGEDLIFIELYLEINKTRLMNRLDFTMNISPEVYDFKIPKLMIQPLIENSIKHGYKDREELIIIINAWVEDDAVLISVVDNGSGMDPHLVKQLNAISGPNIREEGAYGIHSIQQRLYLIYGDKSAMHIESDSQGTNVQLHLKKGDLDV